VSLHGILMKGTGGALVILLAFVALRGLPLTDAAERDASETDPSGKKAFVEMTEAAGILHTHHKPVLDKKLDHIMSWVSSVGAAAAAGDYNNDGWMDLYVTDSKKGTPNYLYRNNGDGTFTDVAKESGVADVNDDNGTSMDCVWGDYDNDGWSDLFVVRWGKDVLFRNRGDGTFEDVSSKLFKSKDGQPGSPWANGNAVVFWDYNLDGRLDLYVGNYFRDVDLWNLETTVIMHDDFETARNGGHNYLWRQNRDGTFTEVAADMGLDDPGWTLAVGSADVNNDGWPDLYCADDFGPDQVFLSNRDGTFTNASESAIGYDTKKGMNVDFGDFNQDGWLDIYVANITTAEYLQEGNMLWHNNGPDESGQVTFTDISLETNTYDGGWGWGAKFFDYDNDGDQDLIAVNGFISAGEGNFWYDLASWTVTGEEAADAANWPAIGDRSFSGYESTRVWRNNGLFSFSRYDHHLGLDSTRDGRGVVVFDYDNDGDSDLFVANQDQPPQLYRNDMETGHHWLTVKLEADPATGVNRDAVGARVTVVTESGQQLRERDGGNSYCGQSDPRLAFGLGVEDRVRLLEVRWPDGGLQYVENIPADQMITVRQDPKQYADQVAIKVDKPQAIARRDTDAEKTTPPIDLEELDRHLSEFETRLREGDLNHTLASTYRQRCATNDRHDRAIGFFEKLVEARPDSDRARIHLSCSYIDKLPTQGGIAAVVSKGRLAHSGLTQLDVVLKRNPNLWEALYCRGMNHLHWPAALRHSDDAAADFTRCVELQSETGANAYPWYARTHIALGDAYAKMEDYAKARQAWRDGLKAFPANEALQKRAGIKDDDALFEFVTDQRSLESAIDTDLSFLDGQ